MTFEDQILLAMAHAVQELTEHLREPQSVSPPSSVPQRQHQIRQASQALTPVAKPPVADPWDPNEREMRYRRLSPRQRAEIARGWFLLSRTEKFGLKPVTPYPVPLDATPRQREMWQRIDKAHARLIMAHIYARRISPTRNWTHAEVTELYFRRFDPSQYDESDRYQKPFDESEHPRVAAGVPESGRFTRLPTESGPITTADGNHVGHFDAQTGWVTRTVPVGDSHVKTVAHVDDVLDARNSPAAPRSAIEWNDWFVKNGESAGGSPTAPGYVRGTTTGPISTRDGNYVGHFDAKTGWVTRIVPVGDSLVKTVAPFHDVLQARASAGGPRSSTEWHDWFIKNGESAGGSPTAPGYVRSPSSRPQIVPNEIDKPVVQPDFDPLGPIDGNTLTPGKIPTLLKPGSTQEQLYPIAEAFAMLGEIIVMAQPSPSVRGAPRVAIGPSRVTGKAGKIADAAFGRIKGVIVPPEKIAKIASIIRKQRLHGAFPFEIVQNADDLIMEGKKALTDNQAAAFVLRPDGSIRILLRENATYAELLHELGHLEHFRSLVVQGDVARAMEWWRNSANRVAKEQWVYDWLVNRGFMNKFFNDAEAANAYIYLRNVLNGVQ